MSEHPEEPRTTPEGVPIIEGPDGLTELDNPMPRWMVNVFWLTVWFSVLYILAYPGVGVNLTGWSQRGQYDQEVADALARAPAPPKDALAAALADPGAAQRGQATYAAQCAACHGADGGGAIGPSLADGTWLYGGKPAAIAHTITKGTQRGMPAFETSLSPTQIGELVAHIRSLAGAE
ncbi:MAG: c-type cytochrome [Candidatus Sericytochromatia bacterium]|nr:c-type cytochrome [Candidatus Sericytochromatia bacterium]